MKFTGDIDDVLEEMATRLRDSTDDITAQVHEEAQRWSLTHLRMRYVDQEQYLHAFVVDCMLRHETRMQEDRAYTPQRVRLGSLHYNGERLVPADPTQLNDYMGSDL